MMNLKHLEDNILLSETKRVVQKERDVTAEVLHYLKEIDRRKLYCDYGYPSLMAFALKELHYSETAANTRIQAARMLADVPEIEEKINDGTLTLTAVGKASGFLKKENIKDPKKKKEVLKKLENKSTRECEKILLEMSPQQPLPKEGVKIVSAQFHQLKINVSDETLKIMEEVRSFMGEKSFNDTFMGKVFEAALESLRRKKFKITRRPRTTFVKTGRYVSNQTKREVSGNGVCENCGSVFLLSFDHREPYAWGGKSDKSNIRLLCFNCNQRARLRARL